MRKFLFGGLIGVLLLSGCKQEVSAPAAGTKKSEYVFGIIAKSNNNIVFQAARKGAEDAAHDLSEKNGVKVRVEWRTPDQEDGQKQANNIEQLTLARVDGIGISCSDASLVTKAIDSAIDSGIPVMCWDSDAPNSKRFAFHGVDNHECGAQVMTELGKVMGGKGVVAVLAGNQTATNLQERVRGVRDTAKQFPGITIKEVYYHAEDPQSASAKVESVQTANPDIQGWAMVGGWPLFSDAIRKNPAFAGGKVKIVSVDALPEALKYLKEDVAQVLLAQGVYQWGYRAVEILYDKAANGKEPPGKRDISKLEPITKAQADEYGKNWEKWLPKS